MVTLLFGELIGQQGVISYQLISNLEHSLLQSYKAYSIKHYDNMVPL